MDKLEILNNLKTSLQSKTISSEEILALLSETRCYFCQNPLSSEKHHQLSFWNGVEKDKRKICYICLRYSYKRNLPLILEGKKELFLEYEQRKIFQKS